MLTILLPLGFEIQHCILLPQTRVIFHEMCAYIYDGLLAEASQLGQVKVCAGIQFRA
jgi:hypothetical protein